MEIGTALHPASCICGCTLVAAAISAYGSRAVFPALACRQHSILFRVRLNLAQQNKVFQSGLQSEHDRIPLLFHS